MRSSSLGAIAVLSGLAAPLRAQAPRDLISERLDSGPASGFVTTTAGRYGAGWLHRFLFGANYRRLWTTPIQVQVLDLRAYAGGLRPVRLGGGTQTETLHLEAADGRKFAFRTVDKHPGRMLPRDLRGTVVEWVLKDQVSAGHPAGAVVVPPLLDAVGVRNAPPQLVVMPDDPALGEFRREFARTLGTLEERPSEGQGDHSEFANAGKVIDTDELFERLERGDGTQVDTRGFLAARLMDDFMGDGTGRRSSGAGSRKRRGRKRAGSRFPMTATRPSPDTGACSRG